MIGFKCPHCQTFLRAKLNEAGTRGTCPKCGKECTVPQKDSELKDHEDATEDSK